MTLREARTLGETFDGRFFERDPRFWSIAAAASRFADRSDWPEPEEHTAEGVRFVTTTKKRERGKAIDKNDLYDAHIARGVVPTRARCWHDYLNALVWATFPKSKKQLHARQLAVMLDWIPDGATTLPNARTREHDALALVDEGGVILLGELPIPFGHALFEGIVYETPAMIARAIPFPEKPDANTNTNASANTNAITIADAVLAARLREPIAPEDLPRYPFTRSDRTRL